MTNLRLRYGLFWHRTYPGLRDLPRHLIALVLLAIFMLMVNIAIIASNRAIGATLAATTHEHDAVKYRHMLLSCFNGTLRMSDPTGLELGCMKLVTNRPRSEE